MGGIAGIIDYSHDLLEYTGTIDEMLKKLAHRGPDAFGIHATHSAALGSRCMHINDAVAAQPMTRSIGLNAYTLIYNGELYNANDLRSELQQKGYAFFTHSDTEVLLVAYIEWGPSCVDKLNGIFAFAVWEEHRQRLFLARDRMGAKPLFYSIIKNALVFASEIKALFCHEAVKPQVGREGVLELFALGPARSPGKTPFSMIRELKPGECMIFSRMGIYIHRYWQFESFRHTLGVEDTAEQLRVLLRDAIKRQCAADVPICTLLSGGLDSSIISAVAASEKNAKGDHLCTYSIEFPEEDQFFSENLYQPNSDSAYIKTVTEFLKCDHTEFTAGLDAMIEALPDAAAARDLPGMADIDSSLLLLCREISKDFKVALAGECADELFAGYPWFHETDLLRSGVFPWANSLTLRQSLLHRELQLSLEDYVRESLLETVKEAPVLKEEGAETSLRRQMTYIHIKWFMANLLERLDRMGMQSGLEIRSPFCDINVAQFAWNIPWDMLHYGGMEKGILRLAMKNTVPAPVLARKKSPYPKTHHPDYIKKVSAVLNGILSDNGSPLLQLADHQAIKQLVENPGNIVTPWFGQLMTAPQLFACLIQTDFWMKSFNVQLDF